MQEHYSLPGELVGLISSADYQQIVGYAVEYARGVYQEVTVDDGLLLVTKEDAGTGQTNLVNLVKNVLLFEREDWQRETVEYLEKLERDQDLEQYLYADYPAAQAYLTVRLQPRAMFENPEYSETGITIDDYIYQEDAEGTYSVLALDMPNRYAWLRREIVSDWGADDAELFAIARANVAAKLDGIESEAWDVGGATVVTMFDNDYAASIAIDFEANCDACIGSFGSIVCFPNRGSVMIHPIENYDEFDVAFGWLIEQVNKFFNEDPGPIVNNLYWYHEHRFYKFPTSFSEESFTYHLPEALLQLLHDQAE